MGNASWNMLYVSCANLHAKPLILYLAKFLLGLALGLNFFCDLEVF
jgi:hypothetical protein